jgi:hypothetical protein
MRINRRGRGGVSVPSARAWSTWAAGLPRSRLLATVGGVEGAIVIGVVTRTGAAVLVALSGAADVPRFRARREIGLIPPGLAAQP